MKKSVKVLLLILALVIIGFLGYKVIKKINLKKEVIENIASIPEFLYRNVSTGKTMSIKNLEVGMPKIFLYYNSECEYCQHEAIDIEENIKKLKNVQILFVSIENPKTIKKFAKDYNLLDYGNIHFLFDNRNTFASTFDATSIPFIVIYDKDNQLVDRIKGQTKVDNILRALEK